MSSSLIDSQTLIEEQNTSAREGIKKKGDILTCGSPRIFFKHYAQCLTNTQLRLTKRLSCLTRYAAP